MDVSSVYQPGGGNGTYYTTRDGAFLKIPGDSLEINGAEGIDSLRKKLEDLKPRFFERSVHSPSEISNTENALELSGDVLSNALAQGLIIPIKDPFLNYAFEFIAAASTVTSGNLLISQFHASNGEKGYRVATFQGMQKDLGISKDIGDFGPDAQFVCLPADFQNHLRFEITAQNKVGFFLEKDGNRYSMPKQALVYIANLIESSFPGKKIISAEQIATQLLVDIVNKNQITEL